MGSRKLCRSVDGHVVEMGFQWNLHVENELMGMYGKIGRMDNAHKIEWLLGVVFLGIL